MAFSRRHFPAFNHLPCIDEMPAGDNSYYQELPTGQLLPNRTWCFMAEIIDDKLSNIPELGHRVEVRDVSGCIHSVLFYAESGHLDFSMLRKGATLFVRYAHRYFFSDLASPALKIEDLNFVKVIDANMDTLLYVTHMHFEQQGSCTGCGASLAALGGSVSRCGSCSPATAYCSPACRDASVLAHATFCHVCSELADVLNVNFDNFVDYVPFRRTLY